MTGARFAVLIICLATLGSSTISPARGDVVVYDNVLASGWRDWSWGGITRDFGRTTPVHAGTASIAVTYTGAWSGLQLGRLAVLDVSAFDTLRFSAH